jgi:hypothetical protein
MESKLMPCKVADLIDVIISHNERVGIWVEYRNGDESGCALLWKGMAHELPRQHLNSRFVRIFGLTPETIMDADIINIIVEIPTPVTTNEPTTEQIVQALRYCADVNSICGDACPAHIDEAGCRTVLMQNAADRLESQEQKIAKLENDKSAIISSYAETSVQVGELIQKLTSRAESAERERDDYKQELKDALKNHS